MNIVDKITSSLPQINEKNRNYVLGAILFVIFLVYYFVVMQPQLSALRTLNPEISSLTEDLKKTRDDIQKIKLYESQVKELQAKVKILSDKVKSKEEVHLILEKISTLANTNHIHVEQIVPVFDRQEQLLKTREGIYYSLPVMLDTHGSYHDFGRFLNDLENDPISLRIEKFTIVSNPQDTMKHVIKLTVQATIIELAKEQ